MAVISRRNTDHNKWYTYLHIDSSSMSTTKTTNKQTKEKKKKRVKGGQIQKSKKDPKCKKKKKWWFARNVHFFRKNCILGYCLIKRAFFSTFRVFWSVRCKFLWTDCKGVQARPRGGRWCWAIERERWTSFASVVSQRRSYGQCLCDSVLHSSWDSNCVVRWSLRNAGRTLP